LNDLIINFTPTGMIPTKKQTPFVPISPSEIISDVKDACALGITMVHLHVRDADGAPHYDKEIYKTIIDGIREFAPELVICASTSGRIHSELEKRAEVLYLEGDSKPDMASLTLSSLNFNERASLNEPEMIKNLSRIMTERGIAPELEVFDSGMINYAKYLAKKKLISPPFYFNLILGNIACAQATLLSAGVMVSELPDNSIFSFGGIGNNQLKINSVAISMGYGVRVGIEDNFWYDSERTTKATNQMLLERIHKIAHTMQRSVMPSSVFRKLFGLKEGNGAYGVAEDR